ncbi:MAG: hypothetical protein AAFP84_06465 [Actinomycetota bacterium]
MSTIHQHPSTDGHPSIDPHPTVDPRLSTARQPSVDPRLSTAPQRTVDPSDAVDGLTSNDERSAPVGLIAGAIAATLLLVAVLAWTVLRSGEDAQPVPDAAPTVDAVGASPESPVSRPDADVVEGADGDAALPVDVVSGPPDVDAIDPRAPADREVPAGPESPVDAPDPVAEPPAPSGPANTPEPEPQAPAPMLAAQATYELDPGVTGLSITLQNQGDAALEYDLLNVGDGYTADVPVGEIDAGGLASIWLDLDVSPAGQGPTPFTRIVEVDSNGGTADITISGQVEKPGFLVVEADSVPLVDFRATVAFTNVGGLPLQITDVAAPGLTLSPIPDAIAAGETLEIELALCNGDPLPPGSFSYPHPTTPGMLIHQLAAHVHLTTDVNAEVVTLSGTVVQLDRPSCEPVVAVPTNDLVLGG